MRIYQGGLPAGSVKELLALARRRQMQLREAQDDYARVIAELDSRELNVGEQSLYDQFKSKG